MQGWTYKKYYPGKKLFSKIKFIHAKDKKNINKKKTL